MKHIVQFSGGKDSTCMLLMMLEKGMQVDEIIFVDVGMEFPQMYEHIHKVEKLISDKYRKHITTLKAEHDYEWYMYEKPKQKGNFQNVKGYGWPMMKNRWCTFNLKMRVTKKFLQGEYILYIGIAYDEENRHNLIKENHRHPLYDWGVTEKMALEYCKQHGFTWGGLYEKFHRVSCWCYPFQRIGCLRTLYHEFPELWKKLKEMDEKALNQFKSDYSVLDLEERFKREDWKSSIKIDLFKEQSF